VNATKVEFEGETELQANVATINSSNNILTLAGLTDLVVQFDGKTVLQVREIHGAWPISAAATIFRYMGDTVAEVSSWQEKWNGVPPSRTFRSRAWSRRPQIQSLSCSGLPSTGL
jgi:hypothetical protein